MTGDLEQRAPVRAWAPDPFRRHELRFRDGDLWTEHVSDRGIPGVDTQPIAGLPRARPPDRTAGVQNPPSSPGAPVKVLAEVSHDVATIDGARLLVVDELVAGAQGPGATERAISDEHGVRIGTLTVRRERLVARALRMFTTAQRRELTELQVVDGGGDVLLTLDRPSRRLKPSIIVRNGTGATVGEVLPERLLNGLSYALVSDGVRLGAVEGASPTDREVRALDASGRMVARVSTTWEVLATSQHPTANTFLIIFEANLAEPLHLLVLGALLALDAFLITGPIEIAG